MQNAVPPDNISFQEDFEDLFEHSRCGFVIMNTHGQIFRANNYMSSLIGCKTEDLKAKRFSELLTLSCKIYWETHLSPLLHIQGFFDEVSLDLKGPGGEKIHILVNADERKDENQKSLFIRLSIFKATDRHLYEKSLRDAKTLAELNLSDEKIVSAVREQFIAVLGHDLRNPLTAITGGAQLLGFSELNDRDSKVVGMIQKSAKRMEELIANIMDFARARLGSGLSLQKKITDIEPILSHVIAELQTAWPDKIIETNFNNLRSINCDPARVSQLFSNLLANALTHGSSDKPVRVVSSLSKTEYELSIINSGIPISPEGIKVLFEPFTREEDSPSKQGLGLGLFISSEIAKAHGGTLSAISNEEETRFTFKMALDN